MAWKSVLKKVGVIAGKGALAQVGVEVGGRAQVEVVRVSDEVLAEVEAAVVRGILRAVQLMEEAESGVESGS